MWIDKELYLSKKRIVVQYNFISLWNKMQS